MKPYTLVDVPGPNLFKGVFPFSAPPLFTFDRPIGDVIDGKDVLFDSAGVKARDIHLTDTTFRDGQQARPPYTKEQTARIFGMLSRLGGAKGVIRQSEFFLYSGKDREKLDACRELGLPFPVVTGWIRAHAGELKLVKEAGLGETGMLTSCSDYHIYLKQRQTRREALDQYLGVVGAAIDAGIRPRCHLEDVTRADLKGFVLPFVQKVERLSEGAPDALKPKYRLCDTLGFGIPFPGTAEPRSIPRLVWRMREECGTPGERLEWHGHNDFHMVHVNGIAAWIYGVDALNSTIFGFGERTGNPPLEAALVHFLSLKGEEARDSGVELEVITELAEYFETEIGCSLPAGHPFAGRDFATTRAGIHAKGLRLNEEIYNIFDTGRLLKRPPKVAITDKSGTDGIAYWVNSFLGLRGEKKLGLTKVAGIQRWVIDQYEKEGRLTAISEEELERQVRLRFPELYEKRSARVSPPRPSS